MIVGRESRSGIGVYCAGFRVVEHDGREGAADIDASLPRPPRRGCQVRTRFAGAGKWIRTPRSVGDAYALWRRRRIGRATRRSAPRRSPSAAAARKNARAPPRPGSRPAPSPGPVELTVPERRSQICRLSKPLEPIYEIWVLHQRYRLFYAFDVVILLPDYA